jgi:hypothetical protein
MKLFKKYGHVGMSYTSFRPCRRNCSARFCNRGAEGVIGIAVAKAKTVARTRRRKVRMVFTVGLEGSKQMSYSWTFKVWKRSMIQPSRLSLQKILFANDESNQASRRNVRRKSGMEMSVSVCR